MAQNAFNLTAQINLRGPSNLRTIVADIRRQVGTVSVDINPTINPAAQRSISDLNRAFRDLNTTLAITEASTRTTANALQNLGQAVNAIGARNLQQNINNAANATQNLATQTQNAAAGANQAATGFEQFGRQSALAIRRFAAFSVVTSAVTGLVSAIRSGASAFIDFDKEFVRLRQVSDSGAASLDVLSKTIGELSTSLGVSSKELTTVAVTFAQAGLSIRETESALKALAKSALAPSFDSLNETVEGSIALMRQFGISSNELESALGSVNAVAAAFAVEASDLISAIQITGGVFSASSKGVSEGTDALNEFLAIFTSIRQTTRESASTIATGLKTIFTRIQRGSTIEALKEYGVVLTDLEGKFVGPFEAAKRLSEGLSSLDTRDLRFAKIVEELGGFRQIGKVIPFIQQFAVAQEALKVAQKGSDSLSKDAAIAQLALANQIAKVREEFLALIRSIGQSESFRSFISLALDLTSGLIKLADSAKVVLPALTAIAAIRGASALTQFGGGFAGAFSAAGGARGFGQRVGGGRRFASGGLVPGSGNQDSINAKLMPGEFVLRKSIVQDVGVGNLRKLNGGGAVQKFAGGLGVRSLKGIRKGARSKFKELSPEEISQLSTADMIKYAKAQARDIFSTSGAGIATSSKLIAVPKERITPELEGDLQTYLGQKGFWQEQISPFGRRRASSVRAQTKMSKEKALGKQQSRLSDEVAARAQKWTSIKQGSSIDNYLLSSLKEPSLSDYKTVRGGGSLAKTFHNTRLRQSTNKALDSFDDFDYSAGNIDRFVSAFAAKKFASGGLVQKFANGETVLQKRERRIQRGYGAGGSGPLQFGLVALRSGGNDVESLPTYLQEPLVTPKNRSVQLNLGTLSNVYKKDFSEQIESSLKGSFTNAVLNLSGSLAKKIGAVSSPSKGRVDRVLEGSGFTAVVGSGLEAALALIGAPYIDKTEATKSLDFPYGLGKAAPLFGTGFPSRVPTDVTRTIGGFGKGKTTILNQIDRFIDATEGGEFTKAFQSRISKKTAAGLSSTLGGILDTLGTRSIKDIAAPGIANQLLQKYGIRARGGLGKSSLEKTLRELPQGQQTGFLSDLDKVINTGKFASGGTMDTSMALLTPGEAVIDPSMAKSIGYSKLKKMNYADKYASGGSVGIVPGSGNGDTFGPVPLPVGSFVLRKKATQALGLNKGGVVRKYAEGGNVETTGGFNWSDLLSGLAQLSGVVLGVSAAGLALKNNFGTISSGIQTFGQNLVRSNRTGFPRTGTGTARPGGPIAGARDFSNQGSSIPRGRGMGVAGFAALAAGGIAIEGLAGLAGEKSVDPISGVRNKDLISSVGGDVLNYATIGATIGSMVPVIGTFVGAVAGGAVGVYTGFQRAAKATEEYSKQIQEVSEEEAKNNQAKSEAERQKKIAEEQKKVQEAFNKLQQVSIDLADAYGIASAKLEKFGTDIDNLSGGTAGIISDLSGQARLQKTNRRDEQVLGNVSGYSLREVRDVGSRVGALAGGQQGQELGQTIAAQKIIQEQLPGLLRANSGSGGVDVGKTAGEITNLLENQLGGPLTGPIKTLIKEITSKLSAATISTDQEGSVKEIASEINKLFGPISEASSKVAQDFVTQFNDTLDRTIDALNQQAEALEKSNELTLRASDIRLRSEIDLQQALGRTLTLQELNAPAQANVLGLSSGVVRGGSVDPTNIGNGINRLVEENKKIESRISELKGSLGTVGGPSYQQGLNDIQAQQQALLRNKVAINNGTKALESLANSSERAQSALNKIQSDQKRSAAFGGVIEQLAVAGPEELAQFNRQREALTAGEIAINQGRGSELFRDLKFRQDFFAGLNQFKELLDPNVFARLQAESRIAVMESNAPGSTTQRIGQGPETVADFIRRSTGAIRQDDPALIAFREAINAQAVANEELSKRQMQAATVLQTQIEALFTTLRTDFPNILKEAFSKAIQDAAAIMAARAMPVAPVGAAVARSKDGPIYASRGALIKEGFIPKGKDTVPAINVNSGQKYMLEEGEMIINKQATNQNYDLLKAINDGDNLNGMYANAGGVISETKQKRQQEYEEQKAEARARFREQKPGLARVLDARADREPRYKSKGIETPEMKKALDEAESRGGKTKTQKQYENDRGQKLFGEFFASTDGNDDYYRELSPDIIFKDLRATGESPVGYSSLNLEDRNLANIAIDSFINKYEYGRKNEARSELEKVRELRAAEAPELAAAISREAREAVSAGIVSSDDLGIKQKSFNYNGKEYSVNDYSTARPLTVNEMAKLRKSRLDKQSAQIDSAASERRARTQTTLDSLAAQREEIDSKQRVDYAAGFETNPYTGKRYSNNLEKKLTEQRAREEGKTVDQVAQEKASRIARTTAMANKAQAERLEREGYAKEQAEYEERMVVASKKASEERRYERIRFETEEKEKGSLGYLAGGISDTYGGAASAVVESTPVQAGGQLAYGLGEVGYGLGVGQLATYSSLATAVGTLGYRAAQYEGDLLGDKPFGPRSKLEDDALAQGGLAATENLLRSSVAAYQTVGTGFDRIGRALTFDKDTMAQTGESASAKRQREISESLPRNSSYIPLPGGNTFRIPSMGESHDVANRVAEEAAIAAVPFPALPFVRQAASAASRRVGAVAGAVDDKLLKPAGKALSSKGGSKVSLPRPLAGQLSPEQQLTNIGRTEATSSSRQAAMVAQEAAIDARTGTVSVRNKVTGEIERIPKKAASDPDAYFAARQAADENTLGRNFERNTIINERKAAEDATAAQNRDIDRRVAEFVSKGDAEAALPSPSVRDLADPERVRRVDAAVRRGRKFEARAKLRGIERPEFSSVPATPEISVPKPKISTNARQPSVVSQPLTAAESKIQQYINQAMELSDEQLGVTTEQVATQSRPNIINPPLENIATREMLEKEATKRRMAGDGYYKGGMIRGKPGIDTNLAAVTRGEFVMNDKSTRENLPALKYMNNGGVIKPRYMAEGGGPIGSTSTSTTSTSSASSFGGSYTISLEDRSKTFMETFVTQLNTFGSNFDNYVTKLAQIKIPDKIEMSGRHTVEVTVTGAAAFEAIEDGVKSLINTEIGKKMNLLWNQSNGQLGESIPTGDVGSRRGSGAQA